MKLVCTFWAVVLLFLAVVPVERVHAVIGRWWGIASTVAVQEHANMVPGVARKPGSTIMLDPKKHPLNKKQRRLVRRNPGDAGEHRDRRPMLAIKECHHQFSKWRWNCPVNTSDHVNSVFGNILLRGCTQTAFIYAVMSAAVAHEVGRNCAEGTIETCSCDYRSKGPAGEDWEWGGCSDNVEFGKQFAKQFVDAGEKTKDSVRYLVNMHNNEAGRVAVAENLRRECKCHGMSGSCTLKTCWMRLPNFRDVGDSLKEKFDGASKVAFPDIGNNRGSRAKVTGLVPKNSRHKFPTDNDLVYHERSPNFCRNNPRLGFEGTRGRECNVTSRGLDGCDLLCCGRGYATRQEVTKERCNCTFQWCCQVKCEECVRTKTIHTCL
uniref:Protein Wnt n=1 Tax=Branchiostoma floridae TaxID=7739 RepID=O61699_BRAFL|nr:AmphiWnt1 [Branchiostoma floridae]